MDLFKKKVFRVIIHLQEAPGGISKNRSQFASQVHFCVLM